MKILDLEEIKDIFIHFEESGYNIDINDVRYVNYSDNRWNSPYQWQKYINDVSNYLKKISSNNQISICESYAININSKNKKSVINFKEWTNIQTNLNTALKRLGKYEYRIDNSMTINDIHIIITSSPILELKNIGDLNLLRKKFNNLNIGKIEFTFTGGKFIIKVVKMHNSPISIYRELLQDDFFIKDLTIDDQIINRKGEVSKDQQNGIIFEIYPKNIDIFI